MKRQPKHDQTTVDGLAALMQHIAQAVKQGQLESKFARKLVKRINKEAAELLEVRPLSESDVAKLKDAEAKLEKLIDVEEGASLLKALDRLREEDPKGQRG